MKKRLKLNQRKLALWALSTVMISGELLSGQAVFAAETDPLAALNASKVLSMEFEGNVTDSSGKGNNGTIKGSNFSYVDGLQGSKALKLDGSTYVDMGKSGTLQPSDLTLSFWIKPNATMTGEQMIMWNKTAWYTDGWYLSSENDSKPLAISLGSADANKQPYKVSISGSRADFFPVGVWTHVAITYDSKTKSVNMYRNGIKQSTNVDYNYGADGADGIITSDETTQKSIGYNGPNYNGAYAKYALDDYEMFSTAARYEDIIALYEQQSGTVFDYEQIARSDADAITLPEQTIGDISLPLKGKSDSTISWTSSNENVIDLMGNVTRPSDGESDATVTLTATVTFGAKQVTREFTVTVPAKNSTNSLQDVPMSNVVLTDSYYTNAFSKEVDYLMSLEPDRLLSAFRTTSGLEAKAQVYDGWENTEIRGHTLGHYLSAISMAYVNASGDDKARLKERLDYIIDELAACQEANGNGYVSAFPTSFLDRVENGQAVWVPWYTLHKILAGLVSAAEYGDNPKALQVAEGLGEYIYNRTSKWDDAMKAKVLSVEYGGMNDALYDLYHLSGNNHFKLAAEKFDELALFNSFYNNVDVLNGKHANTTIPKVIGALKRYEVLDQSESEEYYLQVAKNFWDMVVQHHSYVTGGNSDNEHFGPADVLDAERTNVNDETCNVYNMLKLTRELYKITKDRKYADFYENTYTNSIISSQNPETGMTTYFQPMDTGYFKVFSSEFFHFWCCTGTGMENFSKLNDSVYFTDKDSVYVNMYLSSVLTLPDKNLTLTQKSELPNTGSGDSSSGKVTFTVHTTGQTDTALKFRIPDWAKTNPQLSVNGAPVQNYTVEGGYIVLAQDWTDGTTITLDFPMEVVLYTLPDGPDTVAFKYGPVVLSAGLGTNNMTTSPHGVNVLKPNKDTSARDFITVVNGDTETWKSNIAQNLVKTPGKLEFTLKGTDADGGVLTFTPHFERYEDRYGIYFNLVTADSEFFQEAIRKAKEAGRAESSTVSFVIVANDQYELAANRQTSNSTVGTYNGKSYRDARANGWFSYDMEVTPGVANYLFSTYYSGDAGRKFDIYVDDTKLVSEAIENKNPGDFYNQTRKITQELVDNSRTKTITETDEHGNQVQRTVHYVTVKFASTGGFVGGLFDIFRVITDYKTNANLKSLSFDKGTLSQPFDPEVTEYTLTVPSSATSVSMTAAPTDEYGLVYDGSILINDKLERTVPLTGDTTELVLTAKAEDHTTSKQYTVHLVKGEESPATLTGARSVASNQLFDVTLGTNTVTTNVYAQDITFEYDPEQVEFVEAESLKDGLAIVDKAVTAGKVRLILADLKPGQEAGSTANLVKLQFKAKPVSETVSSSIQVTSMIDADGSGTETTIMNPTPYQFQITSAVTKDALSAAIAQAQARYDAAVEGTHPGQYPAGAKAALLTAIQNASNVLNDAAATQTQVDQALTQLNSEVQTFESSVITKLPGDVNGDNTVRIGDLAIAAAHYGFTSADPNWIQFKSADVNDDGKIDIEDLAALARLIFGE
ncbi:beta-L-arabinofuranosidase domain-containing protein [Paenibacillus hexagrammi]|uniref:Glycoside hydrolase family 127 protein n=1 Tax=Paenibacillus hexagrammi TaxID=2908839 RepID=A0ABY3SBQ2_9BACL|nr:beta-L-arabinofuranosidase domain-containing protein [Paenibacillus sp. YPD9-1]UJF31413.1 glycoside hydrolase family 127 protein [Paenibacillus sp. YPD9-1]